MKRFLHALAALWPKRKEAGRPPAPPTSTGLRQHLAAVIRMERHVSECTDIQSRKRHAVTSDAHPARQEVKRSDVRHPSRKSGSQPVGVSDSTVRRINEYTTYLLDESPNQQIVDTPNKPYNLPRIPQPMPLLTILMLVFFMCLMAAKQVSAQAEPAAAAVIKPLQIGDTIPEELWHLPLQVVNHPDGKETITLNDYRGKLIILDFWGTFCGSCIAAMPKITEVQQQFADDMVVIPVSWSKPDATEQALQTHRTLAPLGLPSVVDAKILIEAFPHGVVPHYAWIDPQGSVVATTATNDVTHANIAKVLEGEEPDYALAKFVDVEKPLLFAIDELPNNVKLQQYAVFIRGSMPSMGSTARLRRTGDTIYGMAIINRRLSTMYSMIASRMTGEHPGKRLLMIDPLTDSTLCTFDFMVSPSQHDSLFPFMLEALNRNSGYIGEWVMRRMDCLVLTRIENNTAHLGGDLDIGYDWAADLPIQMTQRPIIHLIRRLNRTDVSGDRLVIDETGCTDLIDISLRGPLDDLENVRRQLNTFGFDLIEGEREVEVFEIRRSQNQG